MQSRDYEEGASRSPWPRSVTANSLARVVRTALKGEPEAVIERGILQGRQVADTLYCLAVELNDQVQRQYYDSEREFIFLLGYFAAIMGCSLRSISEEQLRALTLCLSDRFWCFKVQFAEVRLSTSRVKKSCSRIRPRGCKSKWKEWTKHWRFSIPSPKRQSSAN